MTQHFRQLHPRAAGAILIVVAMLVLANVWQIDDDSARNFRAAAFLKDSDLDAALAARHQDLVTHGYLEYGSLLVASAGVLLLIAGPRLTRVRR
jgi:hypothetical protein